MPITEEQQKVIDAKDGAYTVVARAGVGKTFCISERVAKLIQSGVNSESILCLTFTNKAAKEMKDRIYNKVGYNQVTVRTFHSLACKIITLFHHHTGVKVIGNPLSEKQLRSRVIQIVGNYGDVDRETLAAVDNFLERVSHLKKAYLKPEDVFDSEWLPVYSELESTKDNEGKITFDDFIYKAVKLFDKHQEALDTYREPFKYIIVDEAQDTNIIQFELLYRLDHTGNVMIVGDVNQGIMGFQGAHIENVFEFEKKYKPTFLYLSKNFRSSKPILDVSNEILNYSIYDEKYLKKAFTDKESRLKPVFRMYTDVQEQAFDIVRRIKQSMEDYGTVPKQFTILYRNNRHSIEFERELIRRAIPYVVKGGKFIERREIQFILACLKVHHPDCNKEQLDNYLTICGQFRNNVSRKTLELIHTNAKKDSFENIVYSDTFIKGIGPKRRASLRELVDFTLEVKRNLPAPGKLNDKSALTGLIGGIMKVMADMIHFEEELTKEEKEQRLAYREEGLALFNDLWHDYFKENPKDTMIDFINDFLVKYSADEDKDKEKEGVILSTVHSYKGLENDFVYVTNLKDGMFVRNSEAIDHQDYLDNINLFYVACSRAKIGMSLSAPLHAQLPWVPETAQGYSLLQIFQGKDLLLGLDEYDDKISQPSLFFEVFEDKKMEGANA